MAKSSAKSVQAATTPGSPSELLVAEPNTHDFAALKSALAEGSKAARLAAVAQTFTQFGSIGRVVDLLPAEIETDSLFQERLWNSIVKTLVRCAPLNFSDWAEDALLLYIRLNDRDELLRPDPFIKRSPLIFTSREHAILDLYNKVAKAEYSSELQQSVDASPLWDFDELRGGMEVFWHIRTSNPDFRSAGLGVMERVMHGLAGAAIRRDEASVLQASTQQLLDAYLAADAIRLDLAYLWRSESPPVAKLYSEQKTQEAPQFWPLGTPSWWTAWELSSPKASSYVRRVIDKFGLDPNSKKTDRQDDHVGLSAISLPNIAITGEEATFALAVISSEFEQRRQEIAEALQTRIRRLGLIKPATLSEGQNFAKDLNELLAQHGCRFRFPNTDDPATLNFLEAREGGGFYLAGVKAGKKTTQSISRSDMETGRTVDDFSVLDVFPVPPDRRRKKS